MIYVVSKVIQEDTPARIVIQLCYYYGTNGNAGRSERGFNGVERGREREVLAEREEGAVWCWHARLIL